MVNDEKLEMRYQNIDLIETRSECDERMIEGYVAVFDKWTQIGSDDYGWQEQIKRGAFEDALKENTIIQLRDHDWGKILGKTGVNLELKEDGTGLKFKLKVPNTSLGDETLELVREKIICGCSFGAYIDADEWKFDNENSKTFRTITKANLLEVTLTPIPAYPQTTAIARDKAKNIQDCKADVDLAWEKKKSEILSKYTKK